MSVAPALSPAEIAALAGPSVPRWFLAIDTTSGNVVATARVSGSPVYPLSDLAVSSTSAGWGNLAPNMTVFIGSTPGAWNKGIYRTREIASTPTTLALMAIGENDSGEINLALRNTGISAGDYITVLDRFDIFGVDPHIDYSGVGLDASIFEDWDDGDFTFNQTPPPRVNLFLDGLPANLGKHVFSGTSYTFDITAEISLWPTSSSANWAFVLPASWTVNSGATSGSGLTATINVTVPHSADTYTFRFVAQENHGFSFTAKRKVWIKSFTYPPIDIVKIDSRVDDRTGSRWTITLNQLLDAAPGAMYHLFDAGTWNGVDVPTASKCFSGYVQRRREVTDIGVSNVSLDLVSPSYILDAIGGQSQIMTAVNATVLTFQQLYYTLSYLDFIIWWLLMRRASGMLQMFNYTPFGLTNTQKRMTDWRIDTGTLLSQVKAQAVRFIGGNFGCDPTGEIMLRRQVSRIPWDDRGDVPIRCALAVGQYKGAELNYEPHPSVRRLRGECFVSDGLTTDTPVWCDAPIIPGQGGQEAKLDRIVADSADELYEGTGNDYQARNNPYPSGVIHIPKNYAVIYPAQMSRVDLDIAPALRYDGEEYSGYVLPTQVSYTHNPDGTIDVDVSVEAETVGLPATDVPIPEPDPSTYNSPYQAIPFNPLPFWRSSNPNPASPRRGSGVTFGVSAGATVVPKDGSVGFCGSSTNAFIVRNFRGTPKYQDVTPSDLGSYQIKAGMFQIGGQRAYLLASNGTNSAVWTTTNLFKTPRPTWTKGTAYTGVYTGLRLGQTTGSVLIESAYSDGPGPWTKTLNFADSSYGAQPVTISGQTSPTPIDWGLGTGFQTYDYESDGGGSWLRIVLVTIPLPASTYITSVTMTYDAVAATAPVNTPHGVEISASVHARINQLDIVTGTNQTLVANAPAGTASEVFLELWIDDKATQGDLTGSGVVKSIEIQGSDQNPYGGGDIRVRASANHGSTFGSAVTVGSAGSVISGFDAQHDNTVSVAGADDGAYKATTLGGAYSQNQATSVEPSVIEIPWYTRNSLTAKNTGTSPQYIYGLPATDLSNQALFWVVSGSPVNITPLYSGTPGVCPTANSLFSWKGKYLAGVFDYGGSRRLTVTRTGGSTWTDRGAAAGASYVRIRRLAATPGQLYIAGNGILQYSPDMGVTRVNKTMPAASLVFFEPYW